MDWEFSSAFSVESLSTQIYAVMAVPRSSICTGKARRMLALHKVYWTCPLLGKLMGFMGTTLPLAAFTEELLLPETRDSPAWPEDTGWIQL